MAYVIAEPCIGTKDTACVDVCPVDCIHPAKDRAYDDGRPTFDEVPHRTSIPLSALTAAPVFRSVRWRPSSRRKIRLRNGTRALRPTRITLTAVNSSATNIKRHVADARLGTALGTYEYTARNHS